MPSTADAVLPRRLERAEVHAVNGGAAVVLLRPRPEDFLAVGGQDAFDVAGEHRLAADVVQEREPEPRWLGAGAASAQPDGKKRPLRRVVRLVADLVDVHRLAADACQIGLERRVRILDVDGLDGNRVAHAGLDRGGQFQVDPVTHRKYGPAGKLPVDRHALAVDGPGLDGSGVGRIVLRGDLVIGRIVRQEIQQRVALGRFVGREPLEFPALEPADLVPPADEPRPPHDAVGVLLLLRLVARLRHVLGQHGRDDLLGLDLQRKDIRGHQRDVLDFRRPLAAVAVTLTNVSRSRASRCFSSSARRAFRAASWASSRTASVPRAELRVRLHQHHGLDLQVESPLPPVADQLALRDVGQVEHPGFSGFFLFWSRFGLREGGPPLGVTTAKSGDGLGSGKSKNAPARRHRAGSA